MSGAPVPCSPAWGDEAVALHVAACTPAAPAAPAPVAPEVIPHQPATASLSGSEHEPLPVAATPTPAIPAAGDDATKEDSTAGLSEQAGDDHVGMYCVGASCFRRSQTKKLLRMSPTTLFCRLRDRSPFILP